MLYQFTIILRHPTTDVHAGNLQMYCGNIHYEAEQTTSTSIE